MGFEAGSKDASVGTKAVGGVQAGVSLIDGVAGVMAARQQGKAAKQAAFANANALRNQATANEIFARENMSRMMTNRDIQAGAAIAARGASGITSEGSGGDAESSIYKIAGMSINDIANQTASHSSMQRYQADLEEWRGKQANKASRFNMFASSANAVAGVAKGIISGGLL